MNDTICKKCNKAWPTDSEQAACIRVYGYCIVCCVEMETKNNYLWSIKKVKNEQHRFNEKKSMDKKDINDKQPPSLRNNEVCVWDLVLLDMSGRDKMGAKKHKKRLQPYNGRDCLIDAYQEALDLVVYLRQAIYERDGE